MKKMTFELPKVRRKKNISCPKKPIFLLSNTFSSKLQDYKNLTQKQNRNLNKTSNNHDSIFITNRDRTAIIFLKFFSTTRNRRKKFKNH